MAFFASKRMPQWEASLGATDCCGLDVLAFVWAVGDCLGVVRRALRSADRWRYLVLPSWMLLWRRCFSVGSGKMRQVG